MAVVWGGRTTESVGLQPAALVGGYARSQALLCALAAVIWVALFTFRALN